MLHPPSEEQKIVVDAVVDGYSVICEALPGSGKSHTILNIAAECKDKKILQITYSSNLKDEVRKKAEKYKLENLEIHSYHSLGYKYYIPGTYNDQDLSKIIKEDVIPLEEIKFDILIIDEAQDMTDDYYEFSRKICRDMGKYYQIVLMGDANQCIFNYKGANSKFLTNGNEYWPECRFRHLSLSTSYRLTNEIARIINNCMTQKGNKIKTIKSGPDVLYLVKKDGSELERLDMLALTIKKYLEKFLPEEILILCPSLNMTSSRGAPSLIANLVNKLTRMGIDINKPSLDLSKDPRISAGKISLLSFHQSKGLEAPVTIIFGFDNTYFKYYGKEYDSYVCPSPLYVAVSRASHHLILFQQSETLPFLKNIEEHTLYYDETHPNYQHREYQMKTYKTSINNIIKHLPSAFLERLTPFVDDLFTENDSFYRNDNLSNETNCAVKDTQNINQFPNFEQCDLIEIFKNLPEVIFTGKTHEYISDLIYQSIISRYEYETTGKSTLLMTIKNLLTKNPTTPVEILNSYVSLLEDTNINTMSYWMKACNIYDALCHKLIYRLNQIKIYDCVDTLNWPLMLTTLNNIFKNKLTYRINLGIYNNADNYRSVYYKNEDVGLKFTAYLDAASVNEVWNFRYSDTISTENKLQLILQSWILKSCPTQGIGEWSTLKFNILNLKTGTTLTLTNDYEKIEKISKLLIDNKLCEL